MMVTFLVIGVLIIISLIVLIAIVRTAVAVESILKLLKDEIGAQRYNKWKNSGEGRES